MNIGYRLVITASRGSRVFWMKLEIAARTAFCGKRRVRISTPGLVHAGGQQVLGVLAVEDREVRRDAQPLAVLAEDAVGDVVEGAAPDVAGLLLDQHLHPAEHLAGRPVGEGDQHDPAGVHAVTHEPRQAVGQGAGLAAACTGDDQHRPARRSGHGQLLAVELRRPVDAPGRRPGL